MEPDIDLSDRTMLNILSHDLVGGVMFKRYDNIPGN